ncbi:MAG: threonine synthase [Acidobacteria bacterium]|nr:MAG: threonine synthase [Acidobacteriota bacterium]
MKSYLTGLDCTRCNLTYSADTLQNLCSCGAPLFARYDLAEISRVISPNDFGYRVHSLWRFRELLPVHDPENIQSLFEGFTPLIHSQTLAGRIGLDSLHFKDESMNPTGSFKARGMTVAVSKARELGVKEIALPTAGNAGGAAAAYAARAGLKCHVFMPADTPPLFEWECRSYGADVRKVRGFITDAGKEMQTELRAKGWFDVSTLKEPYRVEGKKTILYELAQQFNWSLPDVIVFPTGGGTGIVGAWKACHELQQLGWIHRFKMPRLIVVQASGCAPIVRAFEQALERAPEWEQPATFASGLRVPKAVGDFLVLRAVRESGGTALAVSEEEIRQAWKELSESEGLFVAPEAAAAYAGLKYLVSQNLVGKGENIVLLLTGSGLKYANG